MSNSNKFIYKAMPLCAFIKQPKLRVPIGPDAKPNNNDHEQYLQQLLNYVALTNRITNDVAVIGNLGCEAAIYIRFYYLKRFNTMPYTDFKRLFNVGGGASHKNAGGGAPDIAALMRHLCTNDINTMAASGSGTTSSSHNNPNAMDLDYAAIRRRANIKTKYNIKYRTYLFNDLVEKYMWFFCQHVVQSAKLLMIAYYEEFYGGFIPDATTIETDTDSNIVNIKNINYRPEMELLNLEVLIAALFDCPRKNRQTDSILLSSNANRMLFKNYRDFFHQQFPDEPLMPDIEVHWYKYVPFLLRIQEILIGTRPKQQVETLFPCFTDTRHYIKYDDRAIVELLNATNLYVPAKSTVMLSYAMSPAMNRQQHPGETIPYWGKLTQRHCRQFFECGTNEEDSEANSSNQQQQSFCNFVTDGVLCYRMLVNNKDVCRSKSTNLWSNNCCSHQYTNRRNFISLDEFFNPSYGHHSIYNHGSNLISDYAVHCEEKLLRLHSARVRMPLESSATNALCSRCKNFLL